MNDNRPQFLESSYLANLIETAQPDTIIKSITSTDRDSASLTRLTYELRGENSNLFNLNSKTGALLVANCLTPGLSPCLDFERKTHYNLTVTAYDGFGLNSTVPLRIQLLDANDNVPRFERSLYETEIEENADHFDTPLFVHATDLDISSVITYNLISETIESPSTSTNSHNPMINGHPNNGGGMNNLDIIDDDSIIEPIVEERLDTSMDDLKTSGSSLEDTFMGSESRSYDFVEAPTQTMNPIMDGLNEFYHHNFNNQNHHSKQFSVDSKTGEIRVLRPVVYNERPIVLVVKASDGLHSAKCRVRIIARDINNNEPTFEQSVYHANISEIAEIGQVVTKVKLFFSFF